jgi:mRNA interferase HicA
MSDTAGEEAGPMKGVEFIRRVKAHAKANGLEFRWHPDLGKGSHGVLVLGTRRTVVRNPKDELKKGALHGMLAQLGLTLNDL